MEKIFLCTWTDQDKKAVNSYDFDERKEKSKFFTEENGYTKEDIQKIKQLNLGQTHNCSYGNHRIKRLQ